MSEIREGLQGVIEAYIERLPQLDAQTLAAEMYGASRLNSFFILRPDERRITDVLADLLDPKGRHGQGNLFLNAFLQALELRKIGWKDPVTVKVDAGTEKGGLIDLLINHEKFLIGIEMKIFAPERERQLADYHEHLAKEAQSRPFALVFLADQKPKSAQDKVIRMPWAAPDKDFDQKSWRWARPMAAILAETLPDIRSERCRSYINEFLDWIGATFGGVKMKDLEFATYVDAVKGAFGTQANRHFLGAVMEASGAIHQLVVDEIEAALREAIKAKGHEVSLVGEASLFDALAERDKPWGVRKKGWENNLTVVIQSENGRYALVFSGIRALRPGGPDAKKRPQDVCNSRKTLEEYQKAHFSIRYQDGECWFAYQDLEPLYKNWNADFAARILLESPNGNIAQHPQIKALAAQMIAFIQFVDAALQYASDQKADSPTP
ncbi:PD-(D/E)XK nuclease family protein [Novosphingobium humi]|uniref:PD-(D/E)XK nuclease family protein n=1 Tax=Novosphingobium humi TaxID=2282397 RepID=A0ABY7U6R5_9SPHN|nr:PD-(D/E)XK nuclease family protein [Novosphingobium humi]WCT80260.1 PD-(D/E)XK nuclease family protein [Novosphingobium humi]